MKPMTEFVLNRFYIFLKYFIFSMVYMLQILRTDPSKLTTESYTFWFLKAIRAKIVILSLEKEPTFDLACLRFEILGCQQKGNENSKNTLLTILLPFLSAVRTLTTQKGSRYMIKQLFGYFCPCV